jgi:methylaspartate mutase epsilon subunit
MAIYLARNIKLDSMPEFQNEVDLIKSEVRPIVNKVLEMGDGDVALGSVRAFEAGILDIPWSPNKWVKSKVMPARDVDGCLRILDPGNMPFSKEVMEFHTEKLRLRAEKEKQPFDINLAVSSVYEMSESMETLLSDKW